MDLLGQKQMKVGESRYFTIDYTKWLLDNETADSVVAEVSPLTTVPLVVDPQIVDGQTVSVKASGGEGGTQYIIEVTMTTVIDNSPDPNGEQIRVDCFSIDMLEECVV